MVKIDWTLEEAIKANEAAIASGRSSNDPSLPLFQWWALHQLEAYREYFEQDKYYLMAAIRTCANHDLPLPEWAARAYIKAYDAVLNASEKSWDKVFGSPYPKGRHLKAIRQKRGLRFAVLNEVTKILAMKPGTPIDESLFEIVGKNFGIKKTLASEYYYDAKKVMQEGIFTKLLIADDGAEIKTPKG